MPALQDYNYVPKPVCVVCTGEMAVKEVRAHAEPEFEVCFFKCNDCGLEHPVVIDRWSRAPHETS